MHDCCAGWNPRAVLDSSPSLPCAWSLVCGSGIHVSSVLDGGCAHLRLCICAAAVGCTFVRALERQWSDASLFVHSSGGGCVNLCLCARVTAVGCSLIRAFEQLRLGARLFGCRLNLCSWISFPLSSVFRSPGLDFGFGRQWRCNFTVSL